MLLILLILGGCNTVTVRQPPAALLADCPEPSAEDIITNRDLAEALLATRRALRLCNVDKAALREWAGQP
jgi:hypothetical protein